MNLWWAEVSMMRSIMAVCSRRRAALRGIHLRRAFRCVLRMVRRLALVLHPGHSHSSRRRLQAALGIHQEVARRDDPLARPHSVEDYVPVPHLAAQPHAARLEVAALERD